MRRNMTGNAACGASAFFRTSARTLVSAGVAAGLALSLAACGASRINTPDTGAASDQAAAAASAAPADVEDAGGTGGTGTESAATAEDAEAYLSAAKAFSIEPATLFSERDADASFDADGATTIALKDAGSTVEGEGAAVSGSEVRITSGGTYVLAGSLSDGRIVVDVPDTEKVQIVLSGASVTSSGASALYVKSADKVFLTVADGTKNALVATGADADEDGRTLDGAVFAADDLTVNGTGTLGVTSASGSGIVAKDELTVCGGTLEVDAAAHAIACKDSFAAADGTLTLRAKKDGIHVSHKTNGEKGFVYISGGTFAIEAEDDGINATNDVCVDGGTIRVAAGGDGIHSDFDLVVNDGTIDVSESAEGLEGARIEQNGGDVTVSATDDGVNATGDPTAQELTGEGSSMPDGSVQPGDGRQGMRQEMPEGMPEPPEGLVRPEDMPEGGGAGEGAADGNAGVEGDAAGRGPGLGRRGPRPEGLDEETAPEFFGKPGMGGGLEVDESASVTIGGGRLVVDAGGDGLDSNGSIEGSGGEVYVSGPTDDGNAALDYGTTATVTGGIFVATGSAGMAAGFGDESTQGSMLVSLAGNAGDTVTLSDATGSVLASHTPTKSYACVLVSAPGVSAGNAYVLSNGTESKSVTMDAIAYRDVTGFMGGGHPGGGRGGHGDFGGLGGGGGRGGMPQGQGVAGDSGAEPPMGGDAGIAERALPATETASA